MGALNGLRVLDVSNLFAAPQLAAILADYGADVIKVEPPAGDPLQELGVHRDGVSAPYALANRGKRIVTIDLEDDRATLQQLADAANVVVANQPLHVLGAWGLDPGALLRRNPGAVIVTVTCYGTDGPWGDRVGDGSLGEAFGGLTHLTGDAEGPPFLPSIALGDSLVAIAGAFAALAACWSGVGQHVDVSVFEPVLTLLGPAVSAWGPGEPAPTRSGSRVAGVVPRNIYRGSDGRFLVLSATTDKQVARLLPLLGLAADEPLFATVPARLRNADGLDRRVAAWVAERTRDAALVVFERASLPAAPVQDLAELFEHPQVQARHSVGSIDGLLIPGPVAQLRGTPAEQRPGRRAELSDVLASWNE